MLGIEIFVLTEFVPGVFLGVFELFGKPIDGICDPLFRSTTICVFFKEQVRDFALLGGGVPTRRS